MTLTESLVRSIALEPLTKELQAQTTVRGLIDTWFRHADELPDRSPEREELLRVYSRRLAHLTGIGA